MFFFPLSHINIMRKAFALSFIVTLLGLMAYFLKPSEEACIQKAMDEYQKKISYTVDIAPQEINKTVFAKLLEKSFLQKLEVADKFFYRDIYQKREGIRDKIGWAAFGFVQVTIK